MIRFALLTGALIACSDAGGGPTIDASPDACEPASCDDQNTCTTDTVQCASCTHAAIANCCGNGMLESGEACDDGNQRDYDGCSRDCRHEIAFVMKTVTVLDGSLGCDLTGDGTIDNIFGTSCSAPVRQVLSDLLTNQNLAVAPHVSLWRLATSDPTLAGSFDLSFLLGEDVEQPPVVGDYFSGHEPFRVRPEYLTPPPIELAGMAPGGAFTAGGPTAIVPLPWTWAMRGHFPFEYHPFSLNGTVTQTGLSVRLCGAQTAASWHRLPNLFPGVPGTTLLDLMVTGTQLVSYRLTPTQPDIDVDGDGLETFRDSDSDSRVDVCIDGNGVQIQGNDCPFDPRIADAYSMAMDLEAVGAVLAGVAP